MRGFVVAVRRCAVQRLVHGERLPLALQQHLADRPHDCVRTGCPDCAGDAGAGAQVAVQGFQPGRGIDRVAEGAVVEDGRAAEIADHDFAAMHPDAGAAERNAFRLQQLILM